MTIKPLFKSLALAALSCCIVIVTVVIIQLTGQLINLATDFAGGISRLMP